MIDRIIRQGADEVGPAEVASDRRFWVRASKTMNETVGNERMKRWRALARRCALVFAALCAGTQAWAIAALPTGSLGVQLASQPAVTLDAEQLAALPQHTIESATPWTDGVKHFQGPLVTEVMQAAGLKLAVGMTVQARALNGYVVEIPAEDFLRWPVILAWTMDGKVLTRRDKGPLWVVYPRDSDRKLRDAKYDHRWAWQLQHMTVLPASK